LKPGGNTANRKNNCTVTVPLGDNNWRRYAACAHIGGDLFYPAERDEIPLGADAPPHVTDKAKAVCQTCPVQFDCLMTALETGERHGIWGGMSWNERRQLLKTQGLPIPPPPPIPVPPPAQTTDERPSE